MKKALFSFCAFQFIKLLTQRYTGLCILLMAYISAVNISVGAATPQQSYQDQENQDLMHSMCCKLDNPSMSVSKCHYFDKKITQFCEKEIKENLGTFCHQSSASSNSTLKNKIFIENNSIIKLNNSYNVTEFKKKENIINLFAQKLCDEGICQIGKLCFGHQIRLLCCSNETHGSSVLRKLGGEDLVQFNGNSTDSANQNSTDTTNSQPSGGRIEMAVVVFIVVFMCFGSLVIGVFLLCRHSFFKMNCFKKRENKVDDSFEKIIHTKYCSAVKSREVTDCCICLKTFDTLGDVCMVSPCKHIFHIECFNEYLRCVTCAPKLCPICK